MDCSKVRLHINKAMPLWSLELSPCERNACYRTNASVIASSPFLELQDRHAFKFAFLWRSIQILLGGIKTQTSVNNNTAKTQYSLSTCKSHPFWCNVSCACSRL